MRKYVHIHTYVCYTQLATPCGPDSPTFPGDPLNPLGPLLPLRPLGPGGHIQFVGVEFVCLFVIPWIVVSA